MNESQETCKSQFLHERYPVLSEAFGHDSAGHRAFNAVIRHIQDPDEESLIKKFLELPPNQIRSMATVGDMIFGRIREVQNDMGAPDFSSESDNCTFPACVRFPKLSAYFGHTKDSHMGLNGFLSAMRVASTFRGIEILASLTQSDIDNMPQVGPRKARAIMVARQRVIDEMGENK